MEENVLDGKMMSFLVTYASFLIEEGAEEGKEVVVVDCEQQGLICVAMLIVLY